MNEWLRIKSAVSSERGIAFVMVLLVITVFSVLGLSIVSLSINNVKISASEREYESAYYIAEAGIQSAMTQIEKSVSQAKKVIDQEPDADEQDFYSNLESRILSPAIQYTSPNFEKAFGAKPEAVITVTKAASGETGLYEIKSSGTSGSRSRTVKQVFKVDWLPPTETKQELGLPADFSVFSRIIELSSGVNIAGNIGVYSTSPSSVKFIQGTPTVTGDIFVPKGTEEIAVSGNNTRPIVPYEGEVNLGKAPFPAYPSYRPAFPEELSLNNQTPSYTLTLNENTSFKSISVSNNSVLTIDTGQIVDPNESNTVGLAVEKLTLTSGIIHIVGEKKLNLYVKTKVNMESSSKIYVRNNEIEDISYLNMYIKDQTSLAIGGGNKVYGSMYAAKADLSLGGSGVFEGHVFTEGKTVYVGGSAEIGTDMYPSLFYAPRAHFTAANGSEINGLVVADVFAGKGGTTTMIPIDYSSVPFSVPIVRTVSSMAPAEDISIIKKPIREID